MDPILTSPREREAARLLGALFGIVDQDDDPSVPIIPASRAERKEAIAQFVHEVVEAAAEKGRGQIQST